MSAVVFRKDVWRDVSWKHLHLMDHLVHHGTCSRHQLLRIVFWNNLKCLAMWWKCPWAHRPRWRSLAVLVSKKEDRDGRAWGPTWGVAKLKGSKGSSRTFSLVCYSKDEFSWENCLILKTSSWKAERKVAPTAPKRKGWYTVLLLMEEILQQLIGSLFHYFQGFIHPRWLFGISEPSTVGAPFFLPGPMVLRDLDLSIHGGETILLLGDHGSGKSSLILAFLGVSRWFDGVGDLRSLKWLKSFACLRDGHSAFFLQQIRLSNFHQTKWILPEEIVLHNKKDSVYSKTPCLRT